LGGIFLISLDFELAWGILDLPGKKTYLPRVIGARKAIPKILDLFAHHDIHATWATVGFLFFETKEELLEALPGERPRYKEKKLSPYDYLHVVGRDEKSDGLHFGASLIEKIMGTPGQEIGTHTFSHYCCLEEGVDMVSFESDVAAALRAGERFGLQLESFVFPKNQYNPAFLPILREMGIKTVRGNAQSWIYAPASKMQYNTTGKRILRLTDAYVNLTGHNVYPSQVLGKDIPINLPRSRFLRPYIKSLGFLEPRRLKRILDDLDAAAASDGLYHLCLHPHNFGEDMDTNLRFLNRILSHFSNLRKRTGMKSLSMRETYGLMVNPPRSID